METLGSSWGFVLGNEESLPACLLIETEAFTCRCQNLMFTGTVTAAAFQRQGKTRHEMAKKETMKLPAKIPTELPPSVLQPSGNGNCSFVTPGQET